MPRVTDEYRAARRDEILTAAMRAFQRGGFHATSMADIIAESGLSAGAIYGHFEGKHAIIQSVALQVIGSRVGDLERAMARDPMPAPPGLVRVLTDGLVRDVGNASLLVQLWGEAVADDDIRALVYGVFTRLEAAWGAYLARWQERQHGASPAEAAAIATNQLPLYLAAAQGFILQSALMPRFDREKYLAAVEAHLPQ
jgi:AcrR family transcriptional regulator